MKRFLFLILTFIIAVSGALSGCDGKNVPPKSSAEPKSFEQTNVVLASGGLSDYSIVIPAKDVIIEQYIAEELQYFLEQSTGARLPIISDKDLAHDNSKKYLSIGNTVMLKGQTDIVVDYDVQGASGPLIYTKDNTVYLTGADRYGITNAVYKFLEYQIGFKAYATDCILYDYYDTLYLQDFSYNYVPTIQWLALNEYETYGEGHIEDAARMFRIGYNNDGGMEFLGRKTFSGFWCHSCLGIFPETVTYVDETTGETVEKDVYQYSQPCLSNKYVLEAGAQSLLNSVLSSDGPALMVGMKDLGSTCICEDCLAMAEKYATQGGVLLNALNVMAKIVEDGLKELGVDRRVTFVGLMYQGYVGAPTVLNDDGTYSLVSEDMKAYDGDLIDVGVCIAPMHSCFTHGLGDNCCEENLTTTQNIKNWRLATDEMYFYIYGNNFSGCQTYFYNDWSGLANSFNFFSELGAKYVFVESARGHYSPMSSFRVYLKSRLGWDGASDFNKVADEFFPAYYGPACEELREYFNELNEHYEYIYQAKDKYHFGCYENTNAVDYYPYSSIKSYESLLEKAFYDIDNSKYSEKDKEIYRERVNREFLLLKYNEFTLYGESVDVDEKAKLQDYAKQIKEIYGVG